MAASSGYVLYAYSTVRRTVEVCRHFTLLGSLSTVADTKCYVRLIEATFKTYPWKNQQLPQFVGSISSLNVKKSTIAPVCRIYLKSYTCFSAKTVVFLFTDFDFNHAEKLIHDQAQGCLRPVSITRRLRYPSNELTVGFGTSKNGPSNQN
jgi:hypothetical protein